MVTNNSSQAVQNGSFDNINDLADQLTPEIIDNLKQMIELGKKPDGEKLSSQDLKSCMEAVIHWEAKNLSKAQRSGYIAKQCKNKSQKI